MTEELKKFLQTYLAWTEGEETEGYEFNKEWALCESAENNGDGIEDEMRDLFVKEGLNSLFPFNKPDDNSAEGRPWYRSSEEFQEEFRKGTHHLNEKRMAWVRSHCD